VHACDESAETYVLLVVAAAILLPKVMNHLEL